MAAAKSTRRRKRKGGSSPSAELQDRTDTERRRLQKAGAVLTALVYSLDRGLDTEQAGDAAGIALDLIEQAVAALDAVELKRRAP